MRMVTLVEVAVVVAEAATKEAARVAVRWGVVTRAAVASGVEVVEEAVEEEEGAIVEAAEAEAEVTISAM